MRVSELTIDVQDDWRLVRIGAAKPHETASYQEGVAPQD